MTSVRAGFDHFGQRLVADDQIAAASGWGSILEAGDLPVGAADTDLEDPDEDVAGVLDGGLRLIDDPEEASFRTDGDGSHHSSKSVW
jgi:hypothetical protein